MPMDFPQFVSRLYTCIFVRCAHAWYLRECVCVFLRFNHLPRLLLQRRHFQLNWLAYACNVYPIYGKSSTHFIWFCQSISRTKLYISSMLKCSMLTTLFLPFDLSVSDGLFVNIYWHIHFNRNPNVWAKKERMNETDFDPLFLVDKTHRHSHTHSHMNEVKCVVFLYILEIPTRPGSYAYIEHIYTGLSPNQCCRNT